MQTRKASCYIILILLVGCTTPSSPQITDISNQELVQLMQVQDLQLVDVRTPGEVAGGKIEGAQNIDYRSAEFKATINQLDKKKPIVVYCGSGGRSGNTSDLLLELGFDQIYDLTGGFTQWEEENFPIKVPE